MLDKIDHLKNKLLGRHKHTNSSPAGRTDSHESDDLPNNSSDTRLASPVQSSHIKDDSSPEKSPSPPGSPDEGIRIIAQPVKDSNGNAVPNECKITVTTRGQPQLFEAITSALKDMHVNIHSSTEDTTPDGISTYYFIVNEMLLTKEHHHALQLRIAQNLVQSNPKAGEQVDAAQSKVETLPQDNNASNTNGNVPEWLVNMNEISLGAAIGDGRSDNTYRAYWRGTQVAVKVLDADNHSTLGRAGSENFYREVAVVSNLRHPNIVLFLGAAIDPSRFYLVFEFLENGTLTDLIRSLSNGPSTKLDFFRFATEIAQGMNYLHEHSVIHRDLKSENLLLDSNNTVKISDFGLSCVVEMGKSEDLTAETGTYRWMAPEVIRHEPYSSKADIYSYGVVLWELIKRQQPFHGMTPMQAALAVANDDARPALPDSTPVKLAQLIEHCWHQDPTKRPDFSGILEALLVVQKSLTTADFECLGFVQP